MTKTSPTTGIQSAFQPFETTASAALLSIENTSRVQAADHAIQSIVGILIGHASACELEDKDKILSERTVFGLLSAIACCSEFAAGNVQSDVSQPKHLSQSQFEKIHKSASVGV